LQAAHERRDRTLQDPSPQHPVFEKHAAKLVSKIGIARVQHAQEWIGDKKLAPIGSKRPDSRSSPRPSIAYTPQNLFACIKSLRG